ncbi:hypothetical protein DFH07DRAFT_835892 [Mycena maculata]|uniref:Rad60/SUMO-like domain-containing protein n=1 Tax=Mycena maculata TaxID=230809 RepID=A0AAD7IH52_9AGAR|nr:hypothetical protein DFH07DRAFT_835892 [Mycena maculata]
MSTPSGEDVKPDTSKIRIGVQFNGQYMHSSVSTPLLFSYDWTEVFFLYKKTKPLAKLLIMFCERIKVDRKNIRFNYEGVNISREETTAEDLEMEDGDVIDGQLWQEGGSFER